jgi:hypothetical protein
VKDLSAAKWSYVTRRIPADASCRLGPYTAATLGDLVVARVGRLGAHDGLEDVHGRRVRLYSGDLVVGACGNRYASDFYEGYLPASTATHLLTAGGLIGTVTSAHASRAEPTELTIVGRVTDGTGRALSLDDFALPIPEAPASVPATVVVVGSSMNAGKTTTAAALVRGWSRLGVVAGAGKVTGSGSGKDRWTYVDAGAVAVVDFLDFGMSSTFGYPQERLARTMIAIRDTLADRGCAAVVLEIADGLLQDDTRGLLEKLPGFAHGVVLAVSDALGAVAGTRLLADLGVPVLAISGLVTASPLASRETRLATGLPVFTPPQLAEGAAADLLTGHLSPV